MGQVYDVLPEALASFVADQPVYFVATAPLSLDGHVNVSPKGGDTFRVVDRRTVAYLDLTGSGVETLAHLWENGRITLMFCAFEGAPRIVRLYGRGEGLRPGDGDFAELAGLFPELPGVRSVVRVGLDRVSTSCGYGVPLLSFQGHRDQLVAWAERKGPAGVAAYQAQRNAASIDGLPGLDPQLPEASAAAKASRASSP
ncbi:MAG: pyridoxamine 5'-phosphate oxidase family protein [Actinobacteria bacterium]|nr:pyridoxamine 5'-phosphate oxidase family protein [Actinomycetota bacterium]